MRTAAAGAALATVTALTWGGQFIVGKSALARVGAFDLTAIRYFVAAVVLLALLAVVEGRRAFRLDGRGLRLFWLGTVGFAGFNLLAYTGLEHTRPESAALVTALGPLLTALVLWLQIRARPSRATLVALVVALAGVSLVIGHGNPASIFTGSVGWGVALVLAGVFSFVLYTLGAAEFRSFSALRYTALTAGLGWLSIAAATVVANAAGLEAVPSAGDVGAVVPELAYIALLGAVVAVLSWNAAVGLIGPQNASLFGNLIPVTAFAIQIVRGYRPGAGELAGAALTISALVAANLAGRRRPAAAQVAPPVALREAA
jgi:drug/metabolite transporter (DMT)-like permease